VRLVAGVAVVAVAVEIVERVMLARLAATPDPEPIGDVSFPAERIRTITTADQGSLHVVERGAGQPVVLLHGHGANVDTFALLASPIAASGRHVVGLDLRGFGRSSKVPEDFGFRGLVDDVALVLDRLDLHEAIVVGHSMGGAVALGLAIYRSEVAARVRGFVLVNGTARGPADNRRNRAQVVALDWPGLERLGHHPRHGVVLTRANFGTSPRLSHVEAARVIGTGSPVAARRGFARRLLGTDLTEHLPNIHHPVLLLAGSADRVVAARESTRMAGLLPDARVEVFPGAGHMLPLERVDAVAERIVRFAEELDPAAAARAGPEPAL
jgi:pimeloyl-ACP methyl ester carboxylesterase